jgi:hypothetical protein
MEHSLTQQQQVLSFGIEAPIYYKFIYCVFIKNNENDTNLQSIFNNFCEKYNITTKKDEIYSLIETIKTTDKSYNTFNNTDPYILGNVFLFVIYYLKNNNSIFNYLSMMLLLMKATSNTKFRLDATKIHEHDRESEDALIEKTMDEYERIDKLLALTKNIKELTDKLDDNTVYKIDPKITTCYIDYLQFSITI